MTAERQEDIRSVDQPQRIREAMISICLKCPFLQKDDSQEKLPGQVFVMIKDPQAKPRQAPKIVFAYASIIKGNAGETMVIPTEITQIPVRQASEVLESVLFCKNPGTPVICDDFTARQLMNNYKPFKGGFHYRYVFSKGQIDVFTPKYLLKTS